MRRSLPISAQEGVVPYLSWNEGSVIRRHFLQGGTARRQGPAEPAPWREPQEPTLSRRHAQLLRKVRGGAGG